MTAALRDERKQAKIASWPSPGSTSMISLGAGGSALVHELHLSDQGLESTGSAVSRLAYPMYAVKDWD